MSKEVLSIVLAIVGIVVGAGVTIYAQRRWGNRRRRLLFEWRSAPLVPASPRDSGLVKVTFRDFDVDDPHLVTLTLRNVGPGDIASEHFDQARCLVMNLHCQTFYGVTRTSHPPVTVSRAVGGPSIIEIRPALLRRGEEVTIEAIVSGEASPELQSPLIDTDIGDGPTWATVVADVMTSRLLPLVFRSM